MVNALSATNAYKSQMKMMQDVADEVSAASPVKQEESGFAKLVNNALDNAVNTEYKAEGVQMSALTGKADLVDLATALNSAELTLNTIITVRDKAIAAYQDIIRMPI